ncbi:MAG: VWA domain-containing protein [Planctomycetota bacterium]
MPEWVPIAFGRPWLLLVGGAALIWVLALQRASIAGQSPAWARFGLGVRLIVIALLSLGLADLRWMRRADRLSVLFLLDRSSSVSAPVGEAALAALRDFGHELKPDVDRVGLIVFGRDAAVETNLSKQLTPGTIQSLVDRDGTDIAAALRLAGATFAGGNAESGARRVVVISDGNANRGDELLEARNLAALGAVVDVLPLEYQYPSEVLVDSLLVPPEIHPDEPYTVAAIIESGVGCRAKVSLLENDQLLEARDIQLTPGKTRVEFPLVREAPGRYRYEVHITPEPGQDNVTRNNTGYAAAIIRGESRVLFVGNGDEHEPLLTALRAAKISCEVVSPDNLPPNADDYLFYDCLLLANVPSFQLGVDNMKLIHGVVKNIGMGFVMIGGPDSFGAGGYRGTPIEKLLPVDMDVRQRKSIPNGALVMVLHTCEFDQGNMWAKMIAIRALEALSAEDYVGVLEWTGMGRDSWGVPLQIANDREHIAGLIRKLQPMDMPSFVPSLEQAIAELTAPTTLAVQRHVVVISDGDPIPPTAALVQNFIDSKISITTVCINPHGAQDSARMKKLAADTGGKYYFVSDARQLPGIFFREALQVRRSLILEEPFVPALQLATEPVRGVAEGGFPELLGYVITTPKELAEVPLVSHAPHQDPVLAHWRYGLARTAAFTSDASGRWSKQWIGWPGYATFWAQLVRYVAKHGSADIFQVEHSVEGDYGRIVLDAVDANGRYFDSMEIRGRLMDPRHDEQALRFQQTGPGRYEAEFDARRAGSYILALDYRDEAGNEGFAHTGLNVSYSPEFRQLRSNRQRLELLATATGGRVLESGMSPYDRRIKHQLARDPVWQLLLELAIVVFFIDVFFRRVLVTWAPIRRVFVRLFGRRAARTGVPDGTIGGLLARKQSIRAQEQESRPRIEIAGSREGGQPSSASPAPPAPRSQSAPEPVAAERPLTYTERLLEAKRKAPEDRAGGPGSK